MHRSIGLYLSFCITGFIHAEQFVALSLLQPMQVRYSSLNVEEKKTKVRKAADRAKSTTLLQFDEGRSAFGPDDAVPVIKCNDGYALVDGHHTALASKALGAKTLPIRIVKTYTGPRDQTFWQWAEEQGYAYLKDVSGERKIPTSFDDMSDDPLRYFAAITARKFEKSLDYAASIGAERPLWVKIHKDVPFIEFALADALRSAGFVYAYGDETSSAFQDMIERARAVLTTRPVPGLKLIRASRERFDESSEVREYIAHATKH